MDDDAAVSGNEATETQLLHREWGDAWPLMRSSMFVSRRSTTMAGPEDPHVRESFRVSFQLCRPDVLDPIRAREKVVQSFTEGKSIRTRILAYDYLFSRGLRAWVQWGTCGRFPLWCAFEGSGSSYSRSRRLHCSPSRPPPCP